MLDNDLLVDVSEMRRKQDRQAEKLDEHSVILNEHTRLLKNQIDISNKQIDISNNQSVSIDEMRDVRKEFMAVSAQQFQKQDEFNETFLSKLDEISKKP